MRLVFFLFCSSVCSGGIIIPNEWSEVCVETFSSGDVERKVISSPSLPFDGFHSAELNETVTSARYGFINSDITSFTVKADQVCSESSANVASGFFRIRPPERGMKVVVNQSFLAEGTVSYCVLSCLYDETDDVYLLNFWKSEKEPFENPVCIMPEQEVELRWDHIYRFNYEFSQNNPFGGSSVATAYTEVVITPEPSLFLILLILFFVRKG